MTTYYVDPLAGSSANDGLSSGTPLGSFFDFFNGGVSGGLVLGDIVYLMASTADNYPYASLGNQSFVGVDYGSTGSIIQVRGVNPTTLEQDGTQYIVAGNDNQYIARFGEFEGFVCHNMTIVGKWSTYSSGSASSAFINCIFTDAAGGITHTSSSYPMYSDNQGYLYRNCRFYATGSSSNYSSFSARDGNVYGSPSFFDTCEFKDFSSAALLNQRVSSIYNCRFINCGYAASFEYRSNRGGHGIFNCIVDNTTNSAWGIDTLNTTYINIPKAGTFYGNLYNDIGGYIYEYTYPTATEVNVGNDQRSTHGADWEGNVYQNVVSGVHSLPLAITFGYREWRNRAGDTAANFGLTYGPEGYNPTVATGDNILFNHFIGTSAGLGIFLHSLTEAVVSGTVPEFGDVF